MDGARVPAIVLATALEGFAQEGHLCSIAENEAERCSVGALFIHIGLGRGEQCIYVADDDTQDRVRQALIDHGIDVEWAVATRRLALITAGSVSLRGDPFDPYRMFTFWRKAAAGAQRDGFPALRGVVETHWAMKSAATMGQWAEYESQLTELAEQAHCTLLCQYCRQRTPAELMLNVIRSHPSVIQQGALCRNIHHASAEEILGGNALEGDVERLLGTLLEHERSQNALRQQREALTRSELELQQVEQTLQENRLRAEEALRAAQAELARVSRMMTLGELTTSIAHEVAQPLASVITNGSAALRWLAGEPPNLEEVRIALARIIESGRRASDVIERIRALARKADQEKERLDVNEAIREVMALMNDQLRENQVDLQTQFTDRLPLVLADRVQLQQVMLNLIINALEAINVRREGPREILIGTRAATGQLHIMVRDSGIGLPPGDLQDLFKSFYTTKPNGMGIGLSISRTIVEAHHGQLTAQRNESGPGATFHIALPIDQVIG
jgi:C4-dicarboxylate-specific signal transduction histidine kinase